MTQAGGLYTHKPAGFNTPPQTGRAGQSKKHAGERVCSAKVAVGRLGSECGALLVRLRLPPLILAL